MYFPSSGVETPIWLPPLVACIISFFTSMGGVSGAFLLLPFQMSVLGYTSPSVSATNQLFNIVAIPSGVYRYFKEGRMVWPLTLMVVAGTLPGVLIGAVVRVAYLPNPKNFKLFASLVLFYIGIKMLKDILVRKEEGEPKDERPVSSANVKGGEGSGASQGVSPWSLPPVTVTRFNFKELGYDFKGTTFTVSSPGIFALSFVVGIIGGIYGIGGGSIIAPFLVSVFDLPVYTVAGAALMGTFVTSVSGVAFYQLIAPFYPNMSIAPDWLLGFLFGIGGTVGMYLGARCQKFVPARAIKWMLAIIILFTAIKYLSAFFG